jgi:two-component system sensor histidine kinase VicK
MTIISNIMDGIVFVDRSDDITLINPVAEELLGVKAFLAIGRKVAEIAESEGEELICALAVDHAQVLKSADVCRTIEVHHTDQDLLYIKINTSKVLDYKGEFAGVLTVLQDITSEYKADQLKNQYLSIVAHELRTPLTGIKTFSTLMAKGALGPLTDHQENAICSIKEQSVRLEHQIDKLINLGYIDSNDYAQDPELLDVAELVAGAVSPFQVVAKDSGVEIETVVADDAGSIEADRTDIKRALKAIVENAVKFTPEGGKVTVSASCCDGEVDFLVEDTGIGINPRYHRRIFEKFFQVEDPLTRHHGGAGLGLFVAQGVLEAHGSRIEVESELGSGARFRFCLPAFEIGVADASVSECVTTGD